MGEVWLAERADGQLTRQVALKLPRLVWGGALVERLGRERNILASLEHPNITRLYDAGVDSQGRPWLAMEYVEGQAICVYCRERALPLRQRLALLLQVCAAVAHAHARLVVHRDLKPANILVTADGQVRLLDFGIAKLMEGDRTEETALTRLSGRALTLDYASPEQIRGDPLGTASDVYSLGVVAYELLTGARPYRLKRGSAAELEEVIVSADAPLASHAAREPVLKKQLRGDLDAILQQALRKDPAQRYAGIEPFARDIEQHMTGLPVSARPDRRLYRLKKFVLRNWLAVGIASAFAVTVVAGAGVALWQAVVARAQAQRAEEALKRQEAVRQLYVEALANVSSWDVQTFANPGSVMRLLRDKLSELEPQYKDRPQELLAIMNAVSVNLSFAGDFEGSLEVGRKYLALLKATDADGRRTIFGHMTVARALEQLGRLDESEAVLRDAVAWAPGSVDPDSQQARAAAASDLGRVLIGSGKRREADKVLREAESVARRLFPDTADRFDIQHLLGRLNLDFDDAVALQFAQSAQAGYLADSKTENVMLANGYSNLGMAWLANGRPVEAEAAFREAHRRLQEYYGIADRDTVSALGELALALARQRRYDEARSLLAERAAVLRRAATAQARGSLAILRGRQLENELLLGDLRGAAEFVGPADASALDEPIARDAEEFQVYESRWLIWRGRADEALRRLTALQQVLKPVRRRGPVGFHIAVGITQAQLALARYADARAGAMDLASTMRDERATGTWTYRVAIELAALAAARSGNAGEALHWLAELDALPKQGLPPSEVDSAESSMRRAEVFRAGGRPADAIAAIRRALTLYRDSMRRVRAWPRQAVWRTRSLPLLAERTVPSLQRNRACVGRWRHAWRRSPRCSLHRWTTAAGPRSGP
jgi:tetratricopeptide (TPR) repeat protein